MNQVAQRGNKKTGERLRVVLDARPLSHPQAGGFRSYVRSLIAGLAEASEWGDNQENGGINLVLYLDRPLSPRALADLPPGVETRLLDPSRLRTDLRLFGAQVKADAPDLVHGTANYVPLRLPAHVRASVTIHDAMGVKAYPFTRVSPTPRERFINWYWERQTRLSARKAARIVTVSHGAAHDLAEALRAPQERFTVVYNGVALPRPTFAGPRDTRTVLALASPDPRKDLQTLYRALGTDNAEAWAGADAPRLDVVCTSETSRARAETALRACGVADFRLLTGLDNQALADAYARATVFAWPSLLEGFGLPPLEAMTTRCPVVSSDAPAMPEVLDEACYAYVKPGDPAALARALARLLADPDEQREAGDRGAARAAQFTCARMGRETARVWREAAAGVSAVSTLSETAETTRKAVAR